MEETIKFPKFVEDKRFVTKPVLMARYSRDGKALAVVYTDCHISIWDSNDLLVETREFSPDELSLPLPQDLHGGIVFLDWSASSRYLYYVIGTYGVVIDIYSSTVIYKHFHFSQELKSFSCHPTIDYLCIASSYTMLFMVNTKTDINQQEIYKHLNHPERKSNSTVYAQYTGVDDLILLWVNGCIYLLNNKLEKIAEHPLKLSPPMRQRIHINTERKLCIVTCATKVAAFSLPDLKDVYEYRDPVNDSPWASVDYLPEENIILAIPDKYISEGPVFYLLLAYDKSNVFISRELKQRLFWGIVHPSGKNILFLNDKHELILFRREGDEFRWHGPMYPYNFTYLKKSEQGKTYDLEEFKQTYFPYVSASGELEARPSHPIEINSPTNLTNAAVTRFVVDLVPEDVEKRLTDNENELPPILDDIFGHCD